jgi:hypothetical protein
LAHCEWCKHKEAGERVELHASKVCLNNFLGTPKPK